ncbi:MAG: acetolactate decarboxylase, partial [Elusimicrobia bacterium]|nr:acetolactate decarboxylase [Elusimicrobiota bacterium]
TTFVFLTGCSQHYAQKQDSNTNANTNISANATVNAETTTEKSTSTLYQVSTLQALMQGYYYPVATARELKANGDFGIGCFESVNGELIMLDGVVYQAIYDGSVLVPEDSATIPYATVSFFKNDITETLAEILSMENLKEQMDNIVNKNGNNLFYFVRIDGTFDTIKYRSEYAQKEPYKPLAKAMETDQTFFSEKNVTGTIVGLYCPDFMDKLNSVGWHFHYISSDKKKGGHLLEVSAKNADVKLSKMTNFLMKLTEEEKFQKLPLSKDMNKDIHEVETK